MRYPSLTLAVALPALGFLDALAAHGPAAVSIHQDEGRRPEASAEKRELLVRKLVDLSRLPTLDPKPIAATLGCGLGPAKRVTPYRVEYDLAPNDLVTDGRIATDGKGWTAVTLTPAASLGLTLRDIEPSFLDTPYLMGVTTARFPDGPRIKTLDHSFRVVGGMLVVSVPPGRAGTDPVTAIAITSEPRPGLERAPTLRTLRARQEK